MSIQDSASLPLSLVSAYTRLYPGIWDICEDLRSTPDVRWDRDRCYLPIGAGIAVMQHYHMPQDAIFMVPALASWRRWKEIYSFDPTLEQLLYEQRSDTQLPTDVIMGIPFPCVYIHSSRYRFFAHLENDTHDGRWELRFSRILDDGSTRAYFLHIGSMTISESLASVIADGQRVARDVIPGSKPHEELLAAGPAACYSDALNAEAISEMLQLYLYLCSSNADIRQDDQTRKTYRPRNGGKITDKYREIRKWETGFYVGSRLRSISSPSTGSATGTGSAKRPHIRRGHWHHFWKGTGPDRHLELHWVFPLMVHGDDNPDTPARINPIKED